MKPRLLNTDKLLKITKLKQNRLLKYQQMKDAMFVVLLISLINFLVGSIMGPTSESEEARGFIGYSSMSTNNRFYLDLK